jgi:asparagine synthase (glutamine-hydrolysing)
MLFGCFGQRAADSDWQNRKARELAGSPEAVTATHGSFFAVYSPTGVASLDAGGKLYRGPDLHVVLQGKIFNWEEVCDGLPEKSLLDQEVDEAEVLAAAYRTHGDRLFQKLNGSFAVALWDVSHQRLVLARDHLGIEPLFYAQEPEGFCFSTSLHALAQEVGKELDYHTVQRYLLFNYNPGLPTFFKKIQKLPPGHYLVVENGKVTVHRYWFLSFHPDGRSEEAISVDLVELLRESVRRRISSKEYYPGAFLSGGMDSSSVVGLMSPMVDVPVHTFSFRCEGKSFDESHYARIMSEHYQTRHHQVEFPPEQIAQIESLVDIVDEPFCDVGIEIASFLLGQQIGNTVSYVLTGDGGDELFGGHPVYVADKVARVYDLIPAFLKQPLAKGFSLLPDTDEKKSLTVKLKRFSYSCRFPRTLHSNRWRIYYQAEELQDLCTPDLLTRFDLGNGFYEIERLYADADGPDYLSRSLYGDYFTVVDFYLRRMQTVRRFGVEGRYPMLDVKLVEFAAKIPSNLKIRGMSDTKYILRKSMAGVLPDEIVYRKDKLGHSVPMKNWMRESPFVQSFLRDHLSRSTLQRRGFFKPDFVEKMITEHLQRTHNHSHRLWSLLVLELWLQKHVD